MGYQFCRRGRARPPCERVASRCAQVDHTARLPVRAVSASGWRRSGVRDISAKCALRSVSVRAVSAGGSCAIVDRGGVEGKMVMKFNAKRGASSAKRASLAAIRGS